MAVVGTVALTAATFSPQVVRRERMLYSVVAGVSRAAGWFSPKSGKRVWVTQTMTKSQNRIVGSEVHVNKCTCLNGTGVVL